MKKLDKKLERMSDKLFSPMRHEENQMVTAGTGAITHHSTFVAGHPSIQDADIIVF